jgi:hypothetical protein
MGRTIVFSSPLLLLIITYLRSYVIIGSQYVWFLPPCYLSFGFEKSYSDWLKNKKILKILTGLDLYIISYFKDYW